MTNQSTINKLIEMRLTAMSDAFRNQLNDAKMADVPFECRSTLCFTRPKAVYFLLNVRAKRHSQARAAH